MEAKESPYYLGNRDYPPTVLTLKMNGKVINTELPWDASLEDLIDAFYGSLVTVTFQPESVMQAMYEYSKEHQKETEESYDEK